MRMRSDFETIFEFRFTGDGGGLFWRIVGAQLLAFTVIGMPWTYAILLGYVMQNITMMQRRSIRTSQARSRAGNGRRSISSRTVL